jgi:hypothetical protein
MAQSDLLMVNLVRNIRCKAKLDSADFLKIAFRSDAMPLLLDSQK